MKVLKVYLEESPLRNFNYIIYSEVNKNAIFVDPLDIDITMPIVKKLGLNPKYLINTHYHADHKHHNQKLLDEYSVTEILLNDLEVFELSSSEKLQALYTPGHLDPHFIFKLIQDDKAFGVITGDVLFNCGIGNARQGDVNVLFETIDKVIMKLEDDLIVYPAHDYLVTNLKFAQTIEEKNEIRDNLLKEKLAIDDKVTHHEVDHTIKDEKEINPFLRLEKYQDIFPGLSKKEIFINIRRQRDNW